MHQKRKLEKFLLLFLVLITWIYHLEILLLCYSGGATGFLLSRSLSLSLSLILSSLSAIISHIKELEVFQLGSDSELITGIEDNFLILILDYLAYG